MALSAVVMKVRAANVAGARRPRPRLGLLIPVTGSAVLIALAPSGGLAGVISTVPAVLLLIALYVPIVAAMARREVDARVAHAIWLGFGAKLIGFQLRYLVISGAYGAGDSQAYHEAGTILARSYRSGQFFVPVPGIGGGEGTFNLRIITGIVYSVAGSSLVVGALLFSLFSFTGLVLCVKAFRLAVPDGDHPRYARLVLLLPSMFFWPSTIGKDAWMLLGIGTLAYGAARLYTRSFGGLALIATGTAAAALVRPHVALVAFVATAVALLFRRAGHGRRKRTNLVGKLVVAVPLGLISLTLLTRAQTFLEVDELSLPSVQAVSDQVEGRTDQGGSAYAPVPVAGPADLPWAMMTVLFRPFPFEASNVLSFGIALEGVFLLSFTALAWRRILAGLRALGRSPYLVLCGVYTLAFVVAFSTIANFGILARQRVQVFPFFFAFLAAAPGLAERLTSERGGSRRALP